MTGSVLVTGAAGFAGTHLVECLERQGVQVVAWRRPAGRSGHRAARARWMSVDLLDRASVAGALGEIKPAAIYHLAGAAHAAQSWRYVRETFEGNVLATHHLFEGLRANRLTPRVLVACSAHVYAPQTKPLAEDDELKPASPYATSKLATELLAARAWREDGLPTLIARAFNHVGPRQDPSYVASSIARQIALIERGKVEPVLTLGNIEPRRDFTDVRDTVRAYVAMIVHGRPGIPYNVASGRAIAIAELVDALVGRARCSVRIVQDEARFRPNDVPLLVGDRTRLTTDTGWEPRIPFDQTIDDLLDYWRTRVTTDEHPPPSALA
jgi:GDP-4-dehydro-6-deoxy-D-mannose reductase